MIVSELIEKLKKCSPNALVNVECCADATANKVVKYTDGEEEIIYVCDDESLIDETLIERQGFKKEVL